MMLRTVALAVLLTVTASNASARFEMQEAVEYPTTLLLTGTQLAQANSTTPARTYTYADGMMQGISAASSNHGTGASFTGGLAWGVTLGLIGTGIGYFTTGTSSPPNSQMMMVAAKGPDFGTGFNDGYRQEARRKNKGAKLGGGVLGTLLFLVVALS